jgi:hypothetical protein
MADNAQTESSTGFLSHLLQDNPLAVGLVALVLGVLVGLLLPGTSQENALMGTKRDELKQQAQDKVKGLTQKATVIAHTAQDAAQDALGKTTDAAKDAFTEALDTVKEEAEHQGLPVGA